jgi:heavy metal efflux system protein
LLSLPGVTEVRSISRSGISVITVVFSDETNIYTARQLVGEKVSLQKGQISIGKVSSELGPLTTGLGEFYQYYLKIKPGYEGKYSLNDLRTIQDWMVKRRLYGIKGVIEISSYGGHLKQLEISLAPEKLKAMNLSISEVFTALQHQHENTGAAYIEKNRQTYFIRGEGMAASAEELENTLVTSRDGIPVLVRDIAKVQIGHAVRFGALTANGNGEVVGGVVLLTKGENSYQVVKGVKERIATIEKSLPEGISIEPFIDRSRLINKTIHTVSKNLIEGGLIVIFVLVLVLGNFRAGLVVASVIPLAMLFAIVMMRIFDVSANLMSLGAIDFGLVVDGAVIIVEATLHHLHKGFGGRKMTSSEMDAEVYDSATKIRASASFGEFIILIVYIPILALSGVEGKMFGPMAQTVMFAIVGALILSLTWVPMASALFLSKKISAGETYSDRFFEKLKHQYSLLLLKILPFKKVVVGIALGLLIVSAWLFTQLGGEFMPELDEGDFAIETRIAPGSSLTEMIQTTTKAEQILKQFPEVEKVVSRIGASEIPTDPMPIESGDVIVCLKNKSEWTTASTTPELIEKMETALSALPGVAFDFMFPIQMRFNELISGIKADVAVKIYGDEMGILQTQAKEVSTILHNIEGVKDIKVEQTDGLPQILVKYKRDNIARYGVTISELNLTLRTAFAGEKIGVMFEGDRWFDLTLRLDTAYRKDIEQVRNLYISLPNGNKVPFQEVAEISYTEAPMQISRETGKRRIFVSFNVRGRDMESAVTEAQIKLEEKLKLPSGYYLDYGGQFQTLREAKSRLGIIVPITLGVILLLLYIIFSSGKESLLIFTAVPFSAIGGIVALWLRDMPFSVSAGVGFIALFGVAVLNGIVLISYLLRLEKEGMTDVRERITIATSERLRSVLITALVASLGFLPMAISTSAGAEVQKPLATVVIGGLISSTLLTLFVIPILYEWINKKKHEKDIA